MEIVSVEKLPEDIEKKVFRRARRHFEGKNVVHRVVSRNDDIISFIFNRVTHKYMSLGIGTVVTVKKVTIKSPTKKSSVKKAPTKKSSVKKAPAKKSSVKKSPTKKSSVKKTPAKKTNSK